MSKQLDKHSDSHITEPIAGALRAGETNSQEIPMTNLLNHNNAVSNSFDPVAGARKVRLRQPRADRALRERVHLLQKQVIVRLKQLIGRDSALKKRLAAIQDWAAVTLGYELPERPPSADHPLQERDQDWVALQKSLVGQQKDLVVYEKELVTVDQRLVALEKTLSATEQSLDELEELCVMKGYKRAPTLH
jgi:hypothetical protein